MKVQRLVALLALLALLAALVVLAVWTGGGPQTGTARPNVTASDGGAAAAPGPPGPAASRSPAPGPAPGPAGAANPSRLTEVKASELPAEARETLALIATGGPYPYSRDDVSFGNFEGILPRKSPGYYKKYTVRTPGESDRGARRIVAGKTGEKYYTADHYNSFIFIIEGK
ncbi:ribonuclease domain-containing protein [Arthrobacter sp. CG_A4]|uniref:ribonuclease domain-containing protein n=1 Tax=Arthrobacter sp. CG_A4 TaxID=3071706 RepID=UPI002E0B61A4|nr:ribonuclease T1 [Arthrobacter sp. CG_A4]